MQSLDKIVSDISRNGTVKSSFYEISVVGGKSRKFLDRNEDILIRSRCESAMIPGIQILTTDFQLYGGQPIIKVPNSRALDSIQLTFLETSDASVRSFFEKWIAEISNFNNNTVAYYDTVCRDIIIDIFSDEGEKTYSLAALNAVPNRIEMTPIGWGENDQLLKFTVNFDYEELQRSPVLVTNV